MKKNTYKPHPTTLCWSCSKAAGENGWCNWSKNLKPTEGWTAEESNVQHEGPYGRMQGYIVLACPEYISDSEFEKTRESD